MHRHAYIVQVRLAWAEWDLLDRLAAGQRITIEELIRNELCLTPLDAEPAPQPERRHLQIVRPDLVCALVEDA
jgi:hypothetical protein